MSIEYDINRLVTIIEDHDRATWLKGVDIYWKLPKDERPEMTPSENFDGYDQALYQLDDLARGFPLNQVPAELVEALENLQKLSKIYNDYKEHVLGLALLGGDAGNSPPKTKVESSSKESV